VLTTSNAADNGSGLVRLTFTSTIAGNIGDQVGISCHSIGGVIQANVRDTGKIVSSTQIDLLHTTWPGTASHTAPGTCLLVRLFASTTGHTIADNGVEVMTGSFGAHYTLVGIAYIGGSHAVSDVSPKCDVASWFNRRARPCTNTYTSDHTWTSTSAWGEPSSEIACEFVTFDDANENAQAWSINGMFGNSGVGSGTLVSAGFDGTTPEAQVVGEKGTNAPLAVHGTKSGLTENVHTITLLAKTLTGGTSTIFGTTPATTLEIQLWQ
jgi:hypothetical protein